MEDGLAAGRSEDGLATGRSLGVITAATLSASALGFILLGLVARWLTPDQNAAFLSIWGLTFAFGSVISVVEQEIARQSTIADLAGRDAPASVVQPVILSLGISLVGIVVLWLLVGGTVFAGSAVVAGLTALSVSGLAVQFLSRGVFLGTGQVPWYAVVVFLEAFLRVAVVAALFVVVDAPGIATPVAAISAGCFAWVVVVHRLLRSVDWGHGIEQWGVVTHRIGILAAANGLAAVVLTAFPTLVLTILGTSAGLATLFGVVTLTRVPIVLMTPFQAMTVPVATRLVSEGRSQELGRLQVRLGLGATALAAVVAGASWVLGQWAVGVFMGPQYQADRLMVTLLMTVSVFVAAALIQVAVFVALQRYSYVLVTWSFAVVVAVVALLVVPGTNEERGMWSFVAASLAAYGLSYILLRSATRAAGGTAPTN